MRCINADALRAQFPEPDNWSDPNQALVHITGIWAEIDAAPTIEPERQKGHWIETEPDAPCFYRCDHCGRLVNFKEYFCPSCGSFNGDRFDVASKKDGEKE